MIAPRGALQPSMGEILWRDVTLVTFVTCRQKIIVIVNISEYYGRDLVMWFNVCNMSAKNNSDSSEYYGRDLVTWCNVCNIE